MHQQLLLKVFRRWTAEDSTYSLDVAGTMITDVDGDTLTYTISGAPNTLEDFRYYNFW